MLKEELFELKLEELDLAQMKFAQQLKQAESYRAKLMDSTRQSFLDKLWMHPLVEALQSNPSTFLINDVIFDPRDFYERDSKVYYRNVQANLADTTWLSLDDLDVHNSTLVAQNAAKSFIEFFRQIEQVENEVADMVENAGFYAQDTM